VALTEKRRLSARGIVFFIVSSHADAVARLTGLYVWCGDVATGANKHEGAAL
jgi:hypothetical protein